MEKIKIILSSLDFINFHTFSRILLLLGDLPQASEVLEEKALLVEEIISNVNSQNLSDAAKCFDTFLEPSKNRFSSKEWDVFHCLMIPCCFIVGITHLDNHQIQTSIKNTLARAILRLKPSNKGQYFQGKKLSSRFVQKVLEISVDPRKFLKGVPQICSHFNFYSLSLVDQNFTILYFYELILDYCNYYDLPESANAYESRLPTLIAKCDMNVGESAWSSLYEKIFTFGG